MKTRTFGSTGKAVPVIGQGTWQLRDATQAGRALKLGVDLGLTHIDTAELYRGSEETIRDAVGDRRDDLFLVSKVLPHHASYEGTLDACRKSLARLGTDTLDVYLLHWWSDSAPIEDTMRAMNELVDEGRVRHVGVSNLTVAQLQLAHDALGDRPIVCNQVLYHLNARGIETELIPYCRQNDIALVGYSPFGNGNFPQASSPGGRILEQVAQDHDATAHQVALNFLCREEGVFSIPKAETEDHVRQNARALDFSLTKDEVRQVAEAFPRPTQGPLQMI
jgi:diketogulonate reductase-like aldo/keto reductase